MCQRSFEARLVRFMLISRHMIYHLLYISEATPEFNLDTDLERILEHSSQKNVKKEITGVLIKNGNFFIQVLEGKKRVFKMFITSFNLIHVIQK
jgi:hypothetical protein